MQARLVLAILAAAAIAPACASRGESADDSSQAETYGTAPGGNANDEGVPNDLRETGLYSDWEALTVAAEEFTPGFQLWSDGANKTRWILLPEGGKIDVTDANHWKFPVGTKLFKEFRAPVNGVEKRIETRMLWHRDSGWVMTTYVWSDDGKSAIRNEAGIANVPGTNGYQVPSEGQCMMCHRGSVLGFSAVLLAAPEAKGLTYEAALARGLFEGPAPAAADLQIPGTPVEREAIGRLHANCGTACHGDGAQRRYPMRVDVTGGHTPRTASETNLYAFGIDKAATGGYGGGGLRVTPGDENKSVLFLRLDVRGVGQMPPIATRIRDEATASAVKDWIRSLRSPGSP